MFVSSHERKIMFRKHSRLLNCGKSSGRHKSPVSPTGEQKSTWGKIAIVLNCTAALTLLQDEPFWTLENSSWYWFDACRVTLEQIRPNYYNYCAYFFRPNVLWDAVNWVDASLETKRVIVSPKLIYDVL